MEGSPCDNRFTSMFESLFKLCLFESLPAFFCDNGFIRMFESLFKLCLFESLLAFVLWSMHQRVCFSHSIQKKETIEKLSKELYFLNSVQATMSKRNCPKNCVQEKNQRVRVRFKQQDQQLEKQKMKLYQIEMEKQMTNLNGNETQYENLIEMQQQELKEEQHEKLNETQYENLIEMQQQEFKKEQHETLIEMDVETTDKMQHEERQHANLNEM